MLARMDQQGRYHRQNSGGRPRPTAERDERMIVKTAVTAQDSSLSSVWPVCVQRDPWQTTKKAVL